MDNPLVSISCITFNHEPFIRQCLEGFLSQKTSFNYEVLIHDDASTDGTSDIIKEFKSKFPDRIKPIIQEVNQHSRGLRAINATFNYPRARGKYVALCEGDDYWTDPLKLQKQVELMEKNERLSFSFHNVTRVHQNAATSIIAPKNKKEFFSTFDVLTSNGSFMATSSLLFKRDLIEAFPGFVGEASVGDFPLKLILSEFGNIGYLNENMSVYNYRNENSWSANKKFHIEEHFFKMKIFLENYMAWTSKDVRKHVERNVQRRRADMVGTQIENSEFSKKIYLLLVNIFRYNWRYSAANLRRFL